MVKICIKFKEEYQRNVSVKYDVERIKEDKEVIQKFVRVI